MLKESAKKLRLKRNKRTYDRAVASGRFFCSDCQRNFSSNQHLARHMVSRNHKDKLKGITTYDRAVASGRFSCTDCKRNFSPNQHLNRHISSEA